MGGTKVTIPLSGNSNLLLNGLNAAKDVLNLLLIRLRNQAVHSAFNLLQGRCKSFEFRIFLQINFQQISEFAGQFTGVC